MIKLEKVSEKTFKKIINMKLASPQDHFVAPNLYSLAQAWLYQDHARPYAIMKEDEPIGFMMLDWDEFAREAGIWRMMIDTGYQHQGYGRQALIQAIELIRASSQFDIIFLDYVPTNTIARDLYYSLGFRETGEVDDDEIIMSLPLTDHPKLGISKADEDDMAKIMELIHPKDHDFPQLLALPLSEDQLKEAIKDEKVYLFWIMGKTVGLFDGINIALTTQYQELKQDAATLLDKMIKRTSYMVKTSLH